MASFDAARAFGAAEEQTVTVTSYGGAKPCDGDFERLSVLGVGSFGKVVLARHRETKVQYALKIIALSRLTLRKQVERTQLERDVLVGLEHAFIVKLHYAYRVPGHVVLGFEYCAGGELFHHLCKRRVLSPAAVAFYVAELALALQCAHDHGVVYRDVKPENCLLDARGHLKLGDFGLAKTGVYHATTGAHSVCGTPEYMAPDVIARKPSGYGSAVDWWGLGICAYELLTGLPPWYTADRRKLFDRIRLAPLRLPPHVPPDAGAAVAGLLRRHPLRRLCVGDGANELRGNAFFSHINFDALALGAVPSPIRPCANLRRPAHFTNFDAKFTALPVETPLEDGANPNCPAPFAGDESAFDHDWEFAR